MKGQQQLDAEDCSSSLVACSRLNAFLNPTAYTIRVLVLLHLVGFDGPHSALCRPQPTVECSTPALPASMPDKLPPHLMV